MSDFSLFLLCPLCPCFRKVVARAAVSPRCRRHGATVMFSLKPAPLQLSPGTGYYVLLLMLLVLRPRDVVTSRAKHYYHQPQLSRGRTQTATVPVSWLPGTAAPAPAQPSCRPSSDHRRHRRQVLNLKNSFGRILSFD